MDEINLNLLQIEILEAICTGASDEEIAKQLGLKYYGVKHQVREICMRMCARNRTHAAVKYVRHSNERSQEQLPPR